MQKKKNEKGGKALDAFPTMGIIRIYTKVSPFPTIIAICLLFKCVFVCIFVERSPFKAGWFV